MPALGSDKRLKITTAAFIGVAVAVIVWGAMHQSPPAAPAGLAKTPVAVKSETRPETRPDTILNIQKLLTRLGYAPGPADGVLNARTELAIAQFKVDTGATFQVTDYEAVLTALVSAVSAEPTR
ncbi:peptidoglycan-binding domain-containing protein [Asticcacaulis sp. BYS171W]|uniref:Peptidoglycan-binding domain-containing protein n=1 Tax=Asticcacaulis aquaticus TaxID=2984212 RepID=A0ABT5HXF5_9CAUL|nr:peptidoglycan-binding domain-containing protein [Asticcacaulis aquaticus]MDC7684623.1 peptidoglycan-binding domain-containing protein [Asticcacaulis aquaticus]